VPFDQDAESIAFTRQGALDGDGIAISGRALHRFAVVHASDAFVHPTH
jgi:hypothetical protein